jgi:hypothetical protein
LESATKKRCLDITRRLPLLFVLALCTGMLITAKSRDTKAQGTAVQKTATSQHEAAAPKNIMDLQPFRQTSSSRIKSDKGIQGTATLVNLDPMVNTWYLLEVDWQDGSKSSYHLENPKPHSQKLSLDAQHPFGIDILEGNAKGACNLFGGGANDPLGQARKSPTPYASLCDGRLFLRNRVEGHRTKLESKAEFFRNQVWGGEKIAVVFHHILEDSHRETAKISATGPGSAAAAGARTEDVPLPAVIDPKYANRVLTPTGLGIALENVQGEIKPGAWYAASGNPGVYVSLIEPQLINSGILASYKSSVDTLAAVEASSLCYLVAFDLDRFDLGYALGTEHPSVEWSDHIQPGIKDARLPGPDGIGTISPLVATGLVSPEFAKATVATFAGGFKRTHGAFKWGELATENHGSHYGFVEDGVVFSKLEPGLATVFVLDDGWVEMKSWDAQDDRLLPRIKYARQNGVPVVEFDERSQSTVPGQLVSKWGAGNWSGSEDSKLRTIRGGLALQSNGKKRFLIYVVFSDATPSAMARVFQAYRCHYAMHLDMNALEHTYFALYRRAGSQLFVEYLMEGMSEVDKTNSGGEVPRFLGYPDNRDFFFVVRRNQ